MLAALAVVACPVLTFEGGLILLPAALALLIIEIVTARPRSNAADPA
ncbi:MAG TPA: hypothetical protein VK488_13180 [Gaiellaceae bacterium]|nr:hypothetical protein [Gaiellaceae bacterium]